MWFVVDLNLLLFNNVTCLLYEFCLPEKRSVCHSRQFSNCGTQFDKLNKQTKQMFLCVCLSILLLWKTDIQIHSNFIFKVSEIRPVLSMTTTYFPDNPDSFFFFASVRGFVSVTYQTHSNLCANTSQTVRMYIQIYMCVFIYAACVCVCVYVQYVVLCVDACSILLWCCHPLTELFVVEVSHSAMFCQ